jgi:DNA (cytosine-5)-methyltransferase 1
MGGDRSSLITEAIRLIDECRPRFFIWENVKGTFSSNNGEDFWAIIQAFTNIGGYRLEWQLLNTKWFLPQNRERIYLVGYLGDGSGGQVFPIGESSKQTNELQGQQTNTCCLTTRYEAAANGSYVIERKLNAQKSKIKKDTECNKAVLNTNYTYKKVNETIIKNKDKFIKGQFKMMDLHNRSIHNHSPCLVEPHHNNNSLYDGNKIRRLTPIECERLQGFPDNWTQYGESGNISDTQRYKMCGNAVTVDVVEAVANSIIKTIY